jgi:hypothetical protein
MTVVSRPSPKAPWTRFDAVLLAASALFPASLAAFGATSAAPASHDEGVVRVLGLGWTGLFRGLDVLLSAPLALLPLGTRALRAGLASALVIGFAGALAFVLTRALLGIVRPAASPRLMSAVAAVAALTALLGSSWQAEGTAPGGTAIGALLVLVAVAAGRRVEEEPTALRGPGLVLGLAASYEPLVLLAAIAAIGPWLYGRPLDGLKRSLRDAVPAFVLGLAPFAVAGALVRRTPELGLADATTLASPLGERLGARVSLGPWAAAELGYLMAFSALVGLVLAARLPASRRLLASIVGIILVGLLALVLGAASSPSSVGAPVLAALAAAHMLAAITLATVVETIGAARVPFAQASAALVVVLELVLPVRAADETLGRRETRASNAANVWNEVAWGAAPTAAVVLVADAVTMRRIAAARAVGQMRADLLIVPTFALPSRVTDRALAAEPKLAPLYRDVALGSTPEELSLAQLASERPLLAGFDPRWDRNLARHFVPVGLTTRFEPEPRGSSDRRRALDAFSGAKERLVRVVVARKDPDLASATARLLRGRAIGMAACGEREVLSRALDDLRPFAPDDAVASTLVRRIVTSKGAIEVRDLVP